ncbi:hypothetical protein V8C86DRAFT_2676990 [Haematococcus lacustris]
MATACHGWHRAMDRDTHPTAHRQAALWPATLPGSQAMTLACHQHRMMPLLQRGTYNLCRHRLSSSRTSEECSAMHHCPFSLTLACQRFKDRLSASHLSLLPQPQPLAALLHGLPRLPNTCKKTRTACRQPTEPASWHSRLGAKCSPQPDCISPLDRAWCHRRLGAAQHLIWRAEEQAATSRQVSNSTASQVPGQSRPHTMARASHTCSSWTSTTSCPTSM